MDCAGSDARPDAAGELDAELHALAAALSVARGGCSFIFCICNSVPLRERMLKGITAQFPDMVVVALREDEDDAYSAAVDRLGENTPAAISIIGLDGPLLDDDRSPTALVSLNASRELWRKRFACPVVFWVSEAALGRIIKAAPDLWSRKSHLFEFEEPREGVSADWAMQFDGLASDIATWTDARRRARLVDLSARLSQLANDDTPAGHQQRGRWLEESASIHDALGDVSASAAAIDEAATHAKEALDWKRAAYRLTRAVYQLRFLRDFPAAKVRIDEALGLLARAGLDDSPEMAAALEALAVLRSDRGDLQGARVSMARAIAIAEKHVAPDHPVLAASHSRLARILQALGDLEGARDHMQRAIAVGEQHLGSDHPIQAHRYAILATVLKALGDLRRARSYMERAIAIEEQHFATGHPVLATRYSNLALILHDQGDMNAARACMERAIAIGEKDPAADKSALTVNYSNFAGILRELGDLKEARIFIDRAIAIEENREVADPFTLRLMRSNLARVLADEGDLSGAIREERRALDILLMHVDETHPLVRSSRAKLGEYQRRRGEP